MEEIFVFGAQMNRCPTSESGQAGKAESCKGCPSASVCASARPDADIPEIQHNLAPVKLIVAVLSGKGGVGKSTVACNVARCLASRGIKTLILDLDLSGPSVPRLTGTSDEVIHASGATFGPVRVVDNLYAISVGHMEVLEEKTRIFNAVAKNFTIKKILKMADFAGIDVMIIDTPPNITEEHLALANYIKDLCGIIVSTPQPIAFNDVIRQMTFCRKIGMDVVGLIENMKQLVCTKCGHANDLFDGAAIEEYCKREDIPYLGSIAMHASIARSSDSGEAAAEPLFDSVASLLAAKLAY